LFCQYDKTLCQNFDPEGLCRHLLAVGNSAKAITWAETKDAKMADVAFTAGLLHDIGKLMLAANLPDVYSPLLGQAKNRTFPIRGLEMVSLGATHAELGACLLATWGLPLPILDALAWHHTPILSEDPSFTVLTAVHAANVIEHEKTSENATAAPVAHMDGAHLGRLGLSGRRNRWRQLCGGTPRIQDEDPTERMGAARA
jgi:putative nucleotidyltransferase with HDIG domain